MSACTSRPRLGRFGWPGRGRRVGGLIAEYRPPAGQNPGECPAGRCPPGWRNEGLRHGVPGGAMVCGRGRREQRPARRRHDGHACGGACSGARNPGRAQSSLGCPALVLGRRRGRDRFRLSASVRTRAGIVSSWTVPGCASSLSASASAGRAPGLNEGGLTGPASTGPASTGMGSVGELASTRSARTGAVSTGLVSTGLA